MRTRPRSPSGTRDGSQIDPRSPRVAQSSTTFAPASAARASVPPHASDSSSGCAKTPRIVRPASWPGGSGFRRTFASSLRTRLTRRGDEPAVDGDVFVDHALDSEACHGAIANPAAVEIEHARQLVDHVLQVLEHSAGDA